jgi:hypothetical protein
MSPRILIFLRRQRARCLSTGRARGRRLDLAWNSADSALFNVENRGKRINGSTKTRNAPREGLQLRKPLSLTQAHVSYLSEPGQGLGRCSLVLGFDGRSAPCRRATTPSFPQAAEVIGYATYHRTHHGITSRSKWLPLNSTIVFPPGVLPTIIYMRCTWLIEICGTTGLCPGCYSADFGKLFCG